MAGQKLTDKTLLTGNLASDDLLMVVDTSDTTGSAVGTSKKVTNDQILQTTKLSISNAEFLSMRTGGGASDFKELVAAPGSGFMILPVNITMLVTYASATQTASVNLYVGYNPTTATYYTVQYRNFMKNVTTNSTFILPFLGAAGGSHSASIEDAPLVMYSSANFTGGFSADVYVTYRKCSI